MNKRGIGILTISLIIALLVGGIGAYFYFNQDSSSQSDVPTNKLCGDGVCGPVEKQRGICPEDCNAIPDTNPLEAECIDEFCKYTDIEYSYVDGISLKLDLYLPNPLPITNLPVIVEIHGGGFEGGDKFPSGKAKVLTENGFAVASINYRLSGQAIFPAAVQDVKSAVRWLRANSEEYNLDKNNFGAIGGSAGGTFVSFLGTTGNTEEFDVGENLQESSSVKAVVDLFGVINFSSLNSDRLDAGLREAEVESKYVGCDISLESCTNAFKASPINYIDSQDSAFLIIQGEEDKTIPAKQSEDFYRVLQEKGVESELILIAGAGHGSPRDAFENYNPEIVDFFNLHLK